MQHSWREIKNRKMNIIYVESRTAVFSASLQSFSLIHRPLLVQVDFVAYDTQCHLVSEHPSQLFDPVASLQGKEKGSECVRE